MSIEQLIESLNLGDGVDTKQLAKDFENAVNEAVEAGKASYQAELENQYDLKLAESLVQLQESAEQKAQTQLEEHKKELEEYHNHVLQTELAAVDNQLKVAADVRSVRSGLEKIMEGMKEAGIDLSQIHESAVASQIAQLEEQVALGEAVSAVQEYEIKRFQRAFIVSEATRGLTDVARDAVVKSADALDESIETPRFKQLVDILVADKPLAEATAKTVTKESDDDAEDDEETSDKSKKKDDIQESIANTRKRLSRYKV